MPERPAWIEIACANEPDLAAQLRDFLCADVQCLLDESFQKLVSEIGLAPDAEPSIIGQCVGHFRIIGELGRGGMGIVYKAEREQGDFSQIVALKVIRDEKFSTNAQARFLRERSILARLQHHNIAHFLDGGLDQERHPWFAMELIDGQSILSWCDRNRLTIQARLTLLLDVCAAVEYAHGRFVVHRDIKPSNVLVSNDGIVKLLDFGIAKLIEQGSDDLYLTEPVGRLLTPEYASPEQVCGGEITASTDVHALGLLTYELLCGSRAFGKPSATIFDVQREIVEADPDKMASRLKGTDEESKAQGRNAAHLRRTDVRSLTKVLRGDIQNIVSKCLRKSPAQRYATVAEFARDIRCYLLKKPVAATDGALAYRVRKYIYRNAIPILLAGIASLATLVGMAAIVWQARRASDEAELATAARDFLVDVFKSASPYEAGGRVPTAVDLVDSGVQRAEVELQSKPKVRAYLLHALGASYATLGHRQEAGSVLSKAYSDAVLVDGERSEQAQEIALDLAETLQSDNPSSEDAASLLDKIVARQLTSPPAARKLLVRSLIAKGFYEFASGHERESILSMNEAVTQSNSSEDKLQRSLSLESLAYVLSGVRRDVEALAICREVLSLRLEIYGGHSLGVARTEHIMAVSLMRLGFAEEALSVLNDSKEIAKDVLGSTSPYYASILLSYADVLVHLHDLPAARQAVQEALPMAGIDSGIRSMAQADAWSAMSGLELAEGDSHSAARHANDAVKIYADLQGEQSFYTRSAQARMALAVLEESRGTEPEMLLVGAASLKANSNFRPDISLLNRYAERLREEGYAEEALQLHRRAEALSYAQAGDFSPDGAQATLGVVADERDLGRFAAAKRDMERALPSKTYAASLPLVARLEATQASLDIVEGSCTPSTLMTLGEAAADSRKLRQLDAAFLYTDALIGTCLRSGKSFSGDYASPGRFGAEGLARTPEGIYRTKPVSMPQALDTKVR